MKLYLSSYELGNQTDRLQEFVPQRKIGYIPNARDFTGADPEKRTKRNEHDMQSLRALGLAVSMIDLRDYFGQRDALEKRLAELGAIFISGGNVFVLRQAMRLSGLDNLLHDFRKNADFLYAGYSAAGCVLAPDLHAYTIVDPVDTPYPKQPDVIWEGLGFVDFAFMPHWDSNHPESALIEKEITYCIEHGIPYKAIRDGEVLIMETFTLH